MSHNVKKQKQEVEHVINFVEPTLGKPSPHVLDLRKIIVENSKTQVINPPAKVFLDKSSFFELTFLVPFIFLGKLFKKILFFLVIGLKSCLKIFVVKIRQGSDLLFRFVHFFRFSLADYKKILSFGFLAFVFILPLQIFSYYEILKATENKALEEAKNAYSNFLIGGMTMVESDFNAASQNFERAAWTFNQAQKELSRINFVISHLIKALPKGGDKFKTGEVLLFVGEKFSWAGKILSDGLNDFFTQKSEKKLTQKIKILRNRLTVILSEVTVAAERLSQVKGQAIPEDKREVFAKLKNEMPSLIGGLRNLIFVSDLMIKFLGDEVPKRYLFIFQNPGEIRPTGGFMGSLALIDFDQGEIVNLEVPGGGSYDFQGSLQEKIIAPIPMQLINARWELQDANWFPDFPTSAEKIKWFYEKAGGPTIDGVIAINANIIAEILGVVGKIEMPEYNKIIDKDNFIEEIQKSVEIEYDKKENKPKKIIADLAPKLIEKILTGNAEEFSKILAILAQALYEKNILLYSVFPEVEHKIQNFGWGGQMKMVPEGVDYLMVVHTNIGGGKTDWVIDENINLEIKISEDGSIKNKLIIKRIHRGIKGESFSGVRNVDYMRVYVPAGSTLLFADGFEAPPEELFEEPNVSYKVDLDLKNSEAGALIDASSGTKITSEFGKTVFGNWVQVDPGEEVTVTLEYLLPFKLDFPVVEKNWLDNFLGKTNTKKNFYQLLIQKQSGTRANFAAQINFPENWQPILRHGNILQINQKSTTISEYLNADKFYLLGFELK